MSETRITNRSALTYALENLPDAPVEIREKWSNMVAQLDRKNAAPRKLTAQQSKNEGLKAVIVDYLSENPGEKYRVSDLLKQIPELAGDSNQHVSALLRALVDAKLVEKVIEKRVTYFRIAEVEGE